MRLPRATHLVVLCRKGTGRPLAVVRQILGQLDLELNERKSKVVDARQQGFDFLGFELRLLKSRRTGGLYAHVQPSRRSLKRIKERITALTHRRASKIPLPVVMKRVNVALRGWTGYFHYRNCSQSMLKLRAHAEQRVQIHLAGRHKVRGIIAGFIRFPPKTLYDKYVLYKVPATAGWTGRKPYGEEHRKAVCGKTACTV